MIFLLVGFSPTGLGTFTFGAHCGDLAIRGDGVNPLIENVGVLKQQRQSMYSGTHILVLGESTWVNLPD